MGGGPEVHMIMNGIEYPDTPEGHNQLVADFLATGMLRATIEADVVARTITVMPEVPQRVIN